MAYVRSYLRILINAISNACLNVTIDEETEGDGNCFYRAVVHTLQSPHYLTLNDPYLPPNYTHKHLRRDIVRYVEYYSYLPLYNSFAVGEIKIQGRVLGL